MMSFPVREHSINASLLLQCIVGFSRKQMRLTDQCPGKGTREMTEADI